MKRLLLVDDDAVVTRAYRDRLSAHGFRVVTAASGAGALSFLESAKPDLVVLDLMMPEVTGVDVLKFVRGQPSLGATPVVVLANELQNDLGRHAARIGIQKAFRKDQCSPAVLMAAIDEILDPRALATARPSESVADPGAPPDEPPVEATATAGRDDMAQHSMKFFNHRYEQAQLQPNASAQYLGLRLMSSGNEDEVEEVRMELLKAGIASEKRRHPIAEAFGVSGVELWLENEQDFFNASKIYARIQPFAADRPEAAATSQKPETSGGSVGGPKLQAGSTSTPPEDVSKVDSRPAVQRHCAELKQASSLLQEGIEEMLARESELASECAWLHGKVEELTRTLSQAHADAAREIESREAAERNQAEQLTGLLTTLERERLEWQQKLKASDDSCKHAKEQAGSLSRLLETQQAAATALKQELAALELQRDQEERALSDAREAMVAEREARVAAEERAGLVEETLQKQWVERQELERQIQAHAASLGSLLTRVTSKAVDSTGEP